MVESASEGCYCEHYLTGPESLPRKKPQKAKSPQTPCRRHCQIGPVPIFQRHSGGPHLNTNPHIILLCTRIFLYNNNCRITLYIFCNAKTNIIIVCGIKKGSSRKTKHFTSLRFIITHTYLHTQLYNIYRQRTLID